MTQTGRPLSTGALMVTRNGGSEVLQVQPHEVPAPTAGQVRLLVAAAGVNFIDVYQREGLYRVPTPFVSGGEGAGTVESVGPEVTGVAVGDRVAWTGAPGSAAGVALMPASKVVPVPDGLPLELAAAAMLQGITAHYLTNSTYAVSAGDLVLLHAAAGGVGQLVTQLAKAKGATVVGTVSTPAKAEIARANGVDEVINYSEVTDVAAAVREFTGGRGVDVVYDGVGRSTFEASLASLRPRGMLVLFGASSGQVPPFDLQRLNGAGSLFVTRPGIGPHMATREELLWRTGEILGALADGSLRIQIGGRYPLAEAARAYDDLENRRTTGKLILLP